MYYRGEYYNTTDINDAMMSYSLTHWRTPRTRTQRVADVIVRSIIMLPYVFPLLVAGGLGGWYVVHVVKVALGIG